MNELTKKQKEVNRIITKEYNIKVSNKWFNKYLYYYAKCTPEKKITMIEALDVIIRKPESFVFFIYGARAEYVNNNRN